MRIVLDTNVLVAALLSPNGPPAAILRLVLSGRAMLCFDTRIVNEYQEVLRREKFGFRTALIDDLLSFVESEGEHVLSVPLKLSLPDPTDAMFLEVAAAGRVDHIVTGNLRHFPASQRHDLSVVSPSDFLALTRDS